MKNLENIKQQIPDYAKDIRVNLGNILSTENSDLSQIQIFGIALASALATKNKEVILAIENEAKTVLSEGEINGVKSAAAIMAMNNIYYRFLHLAENKNYSKMPANLRMQAIANHGIEKTNFELYSLAVSIINGCGMCIDSHEKHLLSLGIKEKTVQNTARIAAVINALSFINSINE